MIYPSDDEGNISRPPASVPPMSPVPLPEQVPLKKKKKNSGYKISLKLKVIKFYDDNKAALKKWKDDGMIGPKPRQYFNSEIAERFDLASERTVRSFLKSRDEGKLDHGQCKGKRTRRRLKKGRNKFPALAAYLDNFLEEALGRKEGVTYQILEDVAVQHTPEVGGGFEHPRFKKRFGNWLCRFRKDKGWSLRRITKRGQCIPAEWEELGKAMAKVLLDLIEAHEIGAEFVWNGDETSVYLEPTGMTFHQI